MRLHMMVLQVMCHLTLMVDNYCLTIKSKTMGMNPTKIVKFIIGVLNLLVAFLGDNEEK